MREGQGNISLSCVFVEWVRGVQWQVFVYVHVLIGCMYARSFVNTKYVLTCILLTGLAL